MRCLALLVALPTCSASLLAHWQSSQGPPVEACNHIAHSNGRSIFVLDRTCSLWDGNPTEKASWALIDAQGAQPASRLAPATAYSSKRDTLIVWGGERLDPPGYFSDLYAFNFQSRSWTQPQRKLLSTKGSPNSTPFPEYRQAQSNDATVGGCSCMPMWDTDVCGGNKHFFGCGMVPPCDGDNGGVVGQSWCLVKPGACRGAGQDWDYCVINVPPPPAPSPKDALPVPSPSPPSQRPSPPPSARPTPRPTPIPTPYPTIQRYLPTASPVPGLPPTPNSRWQPTNFRNPPTPNLWIPPTLLPTSRPSYAPLNPMMPSPSPTTGVSRIIQTTPVPRGWTQFCWTSDDETTLFMYGGSGSYDGKYASSMDVSLSDGWLLDSTTWSWSPISTMVGYSLASNGTRIDLQDSVVSGLTGHRLGRVERTIYVFGGYSCRKNAQTLRGGPACFMDTLYGFSVDQKSWFQVEESGFWPAGRAYHSLTVVGTQLWVFGGSTMNSFGSWDFFQDVVVFDTVSLRWSAVKTTNTRPSIRWGHVAVRWMDGLWLHGGCATDTQTYSDAFTLKISQAITAENAQARGSGLVGAVPGANTSFLIEVRESYPGPLGTRVFGEPIRAPGLRFDVSVSPKADVGIIFVGDRYEVSFIAPTCMCPSYTVTVRLDGEDVFGSPFVASFLPAPLVVTISVTFDAPQSPDALRDVNNALCYFGASKFNVSVSALQCTLGPSSRRRLLLVSYDFTITAPSNSTLARPLTTEDFTRDVVVSRALRDTRGSIVKVAISGGRQIVLPAVPPATESFGTVASVVVITLNIICLCFAVPCFVVLLYWELRGVQPDVSGTSLVCFGALLALVANFFIPGETALSCHVTAWLLGVGLTVFLGGLLTRNWIVIKAKRPLNYSLLTALVAGVVLADIIINILWQVLDPQNISNPQPPVCKSGAEVFEWVASAYVFGLALFVFVVSVWSWWRMRLGESAIVCAAALNFVIFCLVALGVRVQVPERNTARLVYALCTMWAVMFGVIALCFPLLCRFGRETKRVETRKQSRMDPVHTIVEMQPIVKPEVTAKPEIQVVSQEVREDLNRFPKDSDERLERGGSSERADVKDVATDRRPSNGELEFREPRERVERPREDRERPREDRERPREDRERPREDRERPREDRERPREDRERLREDRERGRPREAREDRERPREDRERQEDAPEPKPRAVHTPHRSQSARRHYHISRRATDRQERRERREGRRGGSPRRSPPRHRETPQEDHSLLREPCSPVTPYPEMSSPLPDIDYFRKKDKVRVHRSHSHHGRRSRRHDYPPPTAPHLSFHDFPPSTPHFASSYPHKYLPSASRLDTEPVRIRYTFRDASPPRSTNSTAITFDDLNFDFGQEAVRQKESTPNVLAPREWKGHRHSYGSSVVTFS